MFHHSREHCGRGPMEFARRPGGFDRPFFDDQGEGGFGRGHGGPFGRTRFFEHGMLRLVLLALIEKQPRHGYDLIKAIEDLTGGMYAPSAGAIYPTLTLLEEAGEIEAQATEGAKKLYAVTEAGRTTIEENRRAIDAVFARFEGLGRSVGPERDPRLMRALENFKLALRLKLRGGSLSSDQIDALRQILDETVHRIEAI